MKHFPDAYLQNTGLEMRLFNKLKNRINIFQLKHDKRVNIAFRKADLLISSIPDSYKAIKDWSL